MSIVCACGGHRLKLMWDWQGTGLWCAACHRSVDPRDLPLPEDLAGRVAEWNRRCAELGRRELEPGRPREPGAWDRLMAEGRALQRELDRFVPTYWYRLLPDPPGDPRCPECGRRLASPGRGAAGFAWGTCEECLLWIAYPERGRG